MSRVTIKTRDAKAGESQQLVDIKHINALKVVRNSKRNKPEIYKSYQAIINTLTKTYNRKYNANHLIIE